MKSFISTFLLSIFLSFGLMAQNNAIKTIDVDLKIPKDYGLNHNKKKTISCSDTILYPVQKLTSAAGIILNPTSSVGAASQYFNAPDTITISGFRFLANSNSTTSASTNITCSIYLAGTDSMPTGAPLASTVHAVDTIAGNNTIGFYEEEVLFPSSITITQPYVVVVENTTTDDVILIGSDYAADDGQDEWLSSGKISGSWIRGYNIMVGTDNYNADWMMYPFVSYNLTSNFMLDKSCIEDGDTVNTTNLSTPMTLYADSMYSVGAYVNAPIIAYFNWNFGDGGGFSKALAPSHIYSNAGYYPVTLRDTMYGWTNTCVVSDTQYVNTEPTASFTYTSTGLTVNFNNTSDGGANSYSWDFGDSNTDTATSPSHTYSGNGTYTVTLIVSNSCGADTTTQSVSVFAVGAEENNLKQQVSVFPNPATEAINIELNGNIENNVFATMVNILGETVISSERIKNGNQNKLDVSALPEGIYILRIRKGNEEITKQISVIH